MLPLSRISPDSVRRHNDISLQHCVYNVSQCSAILLNVYFINLQRDRRKNLIFCLCHKLSSCTKLYEISLLISGTDGRTDTQIRAETCCSTLLSQLLNFSSFCYFFLVRFADGLVYYGVILTTTELMQLNDVCFGLCVCLSVCLSVRCSSTISVAQPRRLQI